MNKKVFACLLAVVMLLGMIVVPTAAKAEGEEPAKEIVVLYTNDVHCGVTDGMGYVGVARVKAALEAAGKEVILVDNGDAVQGDVIGTLSKGEAIVELMNDVGYDVATIGNHEFDYGMDQFKKNVSLAKFQYVCCNFLDDKGAAVLKPYTIIEQAGKRIAFVGIDTPEAFTKSTPKYFQDGEGNFIYSFCEGNDGQDLYNKVQETVDAARAEGADYVIALAHLGVDYQSAPWTASEVIVNTTGIDVVLDGHSHTDFKLAYGQDFVAVKNKEGNEVIHTSTGTKLANVGILTIAGDKITAKLVDTSAMKFMDKDSSWGDSFNDLNNDIKNCMGISHMVRLGAEFKPMPEMAIRAGYNFTTIPEYSGMTTLHDNINSFSVGLGYSSKGSFFADLAARLTTLSDEYISPYADYLSDFASPMILNKRERYDITATVGWRF